MGQIMHVGVTSKDGDDADGTRHRWQPANTIRQRLLKIPGVAEVIVMGERKQYQVLLNPDAAPQSLCHSAGRRNGCPREQHQHHWRV